MKKWIFLLLFCTAFSGLFSQNKATYLFAQRDSQELFLDVYLPQKTPKACVVYAFGGGFMTGNRDHEKLLPYYKMLLERDYMVVAFDYRLGLKGKKINSMSVKPVEAAINLAVEDLYSAVNYLIENREKLQVDTSKIVLIGSSAGAITALQADYMLARKMPISQVLPPKFRFAGVVSFAGAIFSREGEVDYLQTPAPTFFLHGTSDKLVPYKKIQIFNIGFFGTNSLVKRFKKFNFAFRAHRYEDHGHEIASIIKEEIEITDQFIETMVLGRQFLQIDALINNPSLPKPAWGAAKPSQLHQM